MPRLDELVMFRAVVVVAAAVTALLLGYAVESIRMHSRPPFTKGDDR